MTEGVRARLLVVDDDPAVRAVLDRRLRAEGHDVETVGSGEACLARLAEAAFDAVCLDLELPGIDGLETLDRIRARFPRLPVVILTGDTRTETVVDAIRRGAYDYLTKPVDPTRLAVSVRRAVEHRRMDERLARLEEESGGRPSRDILGRSRAVERLLVELERVAATDVTVLVHGESGTGKELVARAIHDRSARRDGPFVALNCAAIPEALQESELFGHEKGAFTGAVSRRRGMFELADGGTLFLDEVAELSPALQPKLLRVLETQRFRRIGATEETRSSFRLIAATHRRLADLVAEGRFREDLYYRLAVFELAVPPLRARREDILLLARKFLAELDGSEKTAGLAFSPEAARALEAYDWPGNVRELRNVVQRAVILASGGVIDREALPVRIAARESERAPCSAEVREVAPRTGPAEPAVAASVRLEEVERAAIAEALRRTAGNISESSRLLGIGRSTLYRKIRRHRLCVE